MAARLLLCALAFLLSACSGTPPSQQEVEKFVRDYAKEVDVSKLKSFMSTEPTVSSITEGKIYQGWQTIRTLYEQGAASNPSLKLQVGTMDVTPLGPETVLAIAPIKISPGIVRGRTMVLEAPGAMTVIVKRTPEGLRVIHEHYSLQPI